MTQTSGQKYLLFRRERKSLTSTADFYVHSVLSLSFLVPVPQKTITCKISYMCSRTEVGEGLGARAVHPVTIYWPLPLGVCPDVSGHKHQNVTWQYDYW